MRVLTFIMLLMLSSLSLVAIAQPGPVEVAPIPAVSAPAPASAPASPKKAPSVQEQLAVAAVLQAQSIGAIASVMTLFSLGVAAFGLVIVLLAGSTMLNAGADEKVLRAVHLMALLASAVAGYQLVKIPGAVVMLLGAAAAAPAFRLFNLFGSVRK